MGRPLETTTLEEKFWSFVDRKGEDDCWPWLGTLFEQDYGRLYHHSTKECKAHRLSYIINKGPIPKGKLVCHTCNNRKCANPKHLYIGTHVDNMEDLANSGVLKGEGNHASKLTKFKVLKIRRLYSKGSFNTRELASRFKVSQKLISLVVLGTAWSHVKGPLKTPKKIIRLTSLEIKDILNSYKEGETVHQLSIRFDRYESTIYRVIDKNI